MDMYITTKCVLIDHLSVRLPVSRRLLVVKFGGVKNNMQIFDCTVGRLPNPCIVQMSTVFPLSVLPPPRLCLHLWVLMSLAGSRDHSVTSFLCQFAESQSLGHRQVS